MAPSTTFTHPHTPSAALQRAGPLARQTWAAVIVASSAGVMLLGFFILVAAMARRLYLHRRVHPLGPGLDDHEEEGAFYGAQPGQAWGEPSSTAAHERLLYRGGGGSGGGDALGASASLYEQFGRVQHYSYDPAARVEPDGAR